MTDWHSKYRQRDYYTIDEAARLFLGKHPLKDAINIEELREVKIDIENAINNGVISVHTPQNGRIYPSNEKKITRESFLSWCKSREDSRFFLITEDSENKANASLIDDMPETMNIVWTLWHEFRQSEDRLTIDFVVQQINSRYAGLSLTEEHKRSCARVLIGTSQSGRPPKTQKKES